MTFVRYIICGWPHNIVCQQYCHGIEPNSRPVARHREDWL